MAGSVPLPRSLLLTTLYIGVMCALGSVALTGTWSQVMQWVVTYELPRHRKLFFQPWRWPELFALAFHDFMSVDGAANEAGNFLETTLAGPTILFMAYCAVTTLRLRVPQGKLGLAIGEILLWVFLDGLVAPSTALPLYFAYRAAPIIIDWVTNAVPKSAAAGGKDGKSHSQKKAATNVKSPLISIVVTLLYAGIVAVCCMSCWRHLQAFVLEHQRAHGLFGGLINMVTGAASTKHSLLWWGTMWAKDINANPITRNLAIDTLFSSLAISLHTLCGSPTQQPYGISVAGFIVRLLLVPFVAAANIVSAGSIWALGLVIKEFSIA